MKKLPQEMINSPYNELTRFSGYFSKIEKTMLPKNVLAKGSLNCFIPYGDKVIPRGPSTTYGQSLTTFENTGVIGHYEKYKNLGGVEMEVKAFRSSDNDLKDVVQVEFEGEYIPITQNPNPNARGNGRIYFSRFFDSDLDPQQTKNLPRLVWVDGYEDQTTQKGRVFSWTGGITRITGVSPTSLTTDIVWRRLGFTTNANGNVFIVVNGKALQVTNPADLDTVTVNVASTTGIVTGDIATSQIEIDETPIAFDNCKQTDGYMFYGNLKYQKTYQSNAYGRPSTIQITGSNALQNDLIISNSADYIGKGRNIYTLTIDSVTPDIYEQTFYGQGTNNGLFNLGGYSGTGNNKYKLLAISDYIITGVGASMTPSAGNPDWEDQVFIGSTSGAIGVAVGGQYAVSFVAPVKMLSGIFEKGETIVGQSTGASVTLLAIQNSNTFQLFKNDIQVISVPFNNSPFYSIQADLNTVPLNTTITLVDGLTFTFPNPTVVSPESYYELNIQKEKPDTFIWQKNNGSTTGDTVSSSDTAIQDGLIVKWVKNTGHSVGDFWKIEVNQIIERAWAEFYYVIDTETQQSLRRPGEGFVHRLPSNFWTMDTFEEKLYINLSNGEWGYIDSKLSADLKTETVTFLSLKQAGANKVIYPYMTGHLPNDLVFVNEQKELVSMGRLQMIQKVQTKNFSSDVQNDFDEASFIDGSIEFNDDKLWITSPEDFVMFCFDYDRNYWQPPQSVPDCAMLSTVGGQLIAHSNLNNTTRKINDIDPLAIGDDGSKYRVIIRTGTYDYGDRWVSKDTNQTFFEAYVEKKDTLMFLTVYFDVDEPNRANKHQIKPVYGGEQQILALFAGGGFGSHQFASSEEVDTTYSREIYTGMGNKTFYFASLEYECFDTIHKYQVLSLGINIIESTRGNKQWIPREDNSSINDILPI